MSRRPLVSILMPTYNDAKYITAAIRGVLNQSCADWELIVIDDGSEDNTSEIVKQFADGRIGYSRLEKNKGQLNALLEGIRHVRGEYVTLLHSDDELSDDKALDRNVRALKSLDCAGVFADLQNMNENGEISGISKTAAKVDVSSPPILFLRGGSNIISDIFFVKHETLDNVVSNYVIWNMPYWLAFQENSIGVLSLGKVEPWYRYRVYPENYLRSEVGRFEALNGCLRTVIEIGKRIEFPFLRIQMLFARALKTRFRPLFRYDRSSPEHLREIVMSVVQRYYRTLPHNIYFKGLSGFYSNFPSGRTVQLQFKEGEIFMGKDARLFFDLMENGTLPDTYKHILEEAVLGFGKIIVDSGDYDKCVTTMKFLSLPVQVETRH